MVSGGRESAERIRQRICGDGARFFQGFLGELDGEERGTGNRGGATLAQEADLGDAAVCQLRRQMQNVAAEWIGHFDARGGVGDLAHISRGLEVIEDRLTEHEFSIPRVIETSNAVNLLAGKTR